VAARVAPGLGQLAGLQPIPDAVALDPFLSAYLSSLFFLGHGTILGVGITGIVQVVLFRIAVVS
jgi:hypothetical protein